jgi:RNA polymerase sigma-70 factor (ECF subfamily)
MEKPSSAPNNPPAVLPLTEWITAYRDSLRTMVDLRMDRRLRSRVDPSDILQETFIEAARRLAEQPASNMSPRLWLRFLARQQLLIAWRRHGGAKSRDVTREQAPESPSVSGDALLQAIAQSATSPSQHLMHEEALLKLKAGLDELEEIDREVLVMRHFEQLSIQETAESLGITVAAASKRYYRALKRIAELIPQAE